MLQLFAFDGDGCAYSTLEHATMSAWQAVQSLGASTTPNEIKIGFSAGLPVHEVLEALAPGHDSNDLVNRFYELGEKIGYDSIRPFPDVIDALDTIHADGLGRVLVTNRTRKSTAAILDQTKLGPLVDDIITCDDVIRGKPHPEGLLKAIARAAVTPEETIYMGDTIGDILTGRSAGVARTIGFIGGFGTPKQLLFEAYADIVTNSWMLVPSLMSISAVR